MSDDRTRLPAQRRRGVAGLALALALAACGGGGGGGGTAPAPWFDPTTYSSAADASLPSATERAAVTRHQLALAGGALAYTATVGHLNAPALVGGAPQASVFYVAYTLDGADTATRPVTFFYNGGPGSASVWLHLGSYGPKRLAAGLPSTAVPRPYALVDNAETLLPASDLVFVDAVGTGYSQAIAPQTNRSFWGVDADAAVLRDFVRRYVEVHGRQASPKWLFGESYGGPRAAIMALQLELAGTSLAGMVLQSPSLDYNSNCAISSAQGIDCTGYLPSYAATGVWHARVPPPADTELFIASARSFADADYAPAAQAWIASSTPPSDALVAQLVAHTGIADATWRSQLNLPPLPVRQGLVPGRLLGRYDTRITAPSASTPPNSDPFLTLVESSFATAIGPYLASLGYTAPSTYVMFSRAIEQWDFRHDGRALPDTLPDLQAALQLNPALKVVAISGQHDLATPFHQTTLDLSRLATRQTLSDLAYPGGHMTYLDDAARVRSQAALSASYGSAP